MTFPDRSDGRPVRFLLLLVRIQSPGGQKAGGTFRIPEVWTVRIPAGDNGDGCIRGRRILPGIRNGKHPVPVKRSRCKEKCMILRTTAGKLGSGNPDQPAWKLRFLKKTVCPGKRQNRSVSDFSMDFFEKLTAGKARAICRKSQKKQIQYHDRAAVIPRRSREFGGCCKRLLRIRKSGRRSKRSFCRRKTVRKRRETVGGIQFRYSSCFHVDDYRTGLQ